MLDHFSRSELACPTTDELRLATGFGEALEPLRVELDEPVYLSYAREAGCYSFWNGTTYYFQSSRDKFCASAIWAGVMRLAAVFFKFSPAALPCAVTMLNYAYARVSSSGTPRPLAYIVPRLYCAVAIPCFAALVYQ